MLLLDAGLVEILRRQHVAIFGITVAGAHRHGLAALARALGPSRLDLLDRLGCLGRGRRGRRGGGLGRRLLGVGAGIGRLEVDDVAEEDLPLVQLVAPDDDGLEGERAFAQALDHGLAAGLDALGDGDLALARQELDLAHLAQVHAHRIVGAVGRLGGALDLDGQPADSARPRARPAAASSASSSLSTTLMPISVSIAIVSSICSEDTCSEGRTALSSS